MSYAYKYKPGTIVRRKAFEDQEFITLKIIAQCNMPAFIDYVKGVHMVGEPAYLIYALNDKYEYATKHPLYQSAHGIDRSTEALPEAIQVLYGMDVK